MTKKRKGLKKKWTLLETFNEKTMSIIVLTLLGTFGLNQLINLVMSRYLTTRAQAQVENSVFTRNVEFSFGIYGIVFAIPVFIVILLLTYLSLNLSKRGINLRAEKEQILFRWSAIYGTVIGFITWTILIDVFNTMTETLNPMFFVVPLFIAPVIAIIVGTLLNRVMVRLTGTNVDLITEVENGYYDFEIKGARKKIIKILRKGDATSIRGAKFRLLINNFFNWILSLFGKIVWFFIEAIFESGNRGSGYGGYGADVSSTREELKRQAHADVDKKRSKAKYTKKAYVNQMNYNSKYAKSEYESALRAEREYKAAKDKVRRM